MAYQQPPTTKGIKQSQEILDAALRCLGRDGYAATSLSRVAEEAGVSKRMVLYYFDSREALFDQLAQSIGDRLIAQLEAALSGLRDPNEAVETGFELMWDAITADRALLVALFGISIEGVTDPRLGATVTDFKNRFRALVQKQIDDAKSHGLTFVADDEVAVTATVAGFLGLAMEWLETGDTPHLRETLRRFERSIAAIARPAE